MPDFPDKLRPPSFKGAPFLTDSHSEDGGRRVQVFEYPQRDKADAPDLGGQAKSFDVDALVIGDGYMAKRDRLLKALNTPGPGELIHPYRGRLWVVALPYQMTESSRDGGMARFRLTFIEVNENSDQSDGRLDLTAEALSAADEMDAVTKADFAKAYAVAGQPSRVLDEAAKVVRAAQDQVDKLGARLSGYGAPFDSFIAQGKALRQNVLKLAASPLQLAAGVTGIIQGLRTLAGTPAEVFGLLGTLMQWRPLAGVAPGTPTRDRQAANQAAITAMVQQTAAAEAIRAAAGIAFSSYDEASAVRDAIDDGLDALILDAGDAPRDAAFRALTDARAAILNDIDARGRDLARLYSYTPAETMSATVLAYRLYGVADIEAHAAEICSRNGISHPGFLLGGQPVEVRSDV